MKTLKKSGGRRRKKDAKPHRKVLEETRALLINSGQVVGLPNKYFLPQSKC
jgi:hypothetical protein